MTICAGYSVGSLLRAWLVESLATWQVMASCLWMTGAELSLS